MEQMLKRCSSCKKDISLKDFYKTKHYKDGLTRKCKNCFHLYFKKTYSPYKRSLSFKNKKILCHCGTLMTNYAKRCNACYIDLRKKHIIKTGISFERGEKHPFWKNATRKLRDLIEGSKEYKNWRASIFIRDNWTCQICKNVGGTLNAHHIIFLSKILSDFKIKDFDGAILCDIMWDINNGITLCVNCHRDIHFKLKKDTCYFPKRKTNKSKK